MSDQIFYLNARAGKGFGVNSRGFRKRFCIFGVISFFALAVCHGAAAQQSMTCGIAVSQLQSYVVQVNQFATNEYYRGIPGRCLGNPNCMQIWLQQLNAWYYQQSALVNGWYQQIVLQCSSSQHADTTVHSQAPTQNQPGQLDESSVENIDVDNEDKTVKIHIPATPSGFR